MGEKTKVALYFILVGLSCSPIAIITMFAALLCCVLPGCEIAPTPTPKIRVERVETSEWAGVTVYFDSHYQESTGGPHFVTLNSPEEIEAYKEQVEFLLSRLEEVELRMNVHEPPLEPVVE